MLAGDFFGAFNSCLRKIPQPPKEDFGGDFTKMAIDILPLLKQRDSYRVQRSVVALLNHLGGFLLLIPIGIHFTGEPGMPCPYRSGSQIS